MLKQSLLSISIFCSVLLVTPQVCAVKKRALSRSKTLSNKHLETALIEAASNGDMTTVKVVIDFAKKMKNTTVLVNVQDNEGHTPLMYAAAEGRKSVVHHLLGHGANPNMVNSEGRTALMYAVSNSYKKIASVLAREGKGSIDRCDNNGISALMAGICQDNQEIVRTLLHAGASVPQKTVSGPSPLFLAVRRSCNRIIELLLDHGGSVNETTQCDDSLLMLASKDDREAAVQLLIDREVTVDAQNNRGDTALLIAASNGSKKACRLLSEAGADVNICNELGDTPLHCAAAGGHVAIMKMLLKQGALVNAANALGITPLMSALDAKSEEAVQLLLTKGADVHAQMVGGDVLRIALERSSYLCLRVLLETDQFDLEARDSEGNTTLLQAIKYGNYEIVSELLNSGASPNVFDNKKKTPLTLAISKKNAAMAHILLRHKKTDKNQQNGQGQTPLMLAAFIKHKGLCTRLLASGAQVHLTDKKSRTALDYALAVRDSDIARKLLGHMEPPFPVEKLQKIGIELTYLHGYSMH
jgi:ankyrin repeat protein